jgi:uncharacterized protein YecE (DUF72 family)
MSTILVGTSSWTDKTLIDCGRFYPPSATTAEERLRFYASQFPIVEIDSSYYGIPSIENAQRWVERTPSGFVFNVKAYRLFTRHQTWNKKGLTSSSQRFDYDYSEDELRDLAGEIDVLASKATTTHVLCNINYQDQGQRAARTLTQILEEA